MELSVDVPPVSVSQVLDGMRRPFLKPFGRTILGRRLGNAAWTAFHAALVHGHGVALATSHARVAAEERNLRTMLVARWTSRRIARVVSRAAARAANAS